MGAPISAQAEAPAQLESRDTGKPISQARNDILVAALAMGNAAALKPSEDACDAVGVLQHRQGGGSAATTSSLPSAASGAAFAGRAARGAWHGRRRTGSTKSLPQVQVRLCAVA
jgi:hypothetical protein